MVFYPRVSELLHWHRGNNDIGPGAIQVTLKSMWKSAATKWQKKHVMCTFLGLCCSRVYHDDVIKRKHFPRYWPFVKGIHRSPVNSPHKGQWRGALIFSLICAWINGGVNHREAGDLRRHRAHYDVTVMVVEFLWILYHTRTQKSFMAQTASSCLSKNVRA